MDELEFCAARLTGATLAEAVCTGHARQVLMRKRVSS